MSDSEVRSIYGGAGPIELVVSVIPSRLGYY